MNAYTLICDEIEKGFMSNLRIAILAIAFWIINADGMTDDFLQSVMTQFGFTFDIPTETFVAEGTTYTIYELLNYSIINIFRSERTLTTAELRCIIKKSENMEYITVEQRATLETALAAQVVNQL